MGFLGIGSAVSGANIQKGANKPRPESESARKKSHMKRVAAMLLVAAHALTLISASPALADGVLCEDLPDGRTHCTEHEHEKLSDGYVIGGVLLGLLVAAWTEGWFDNEPGAGSRSSPSLQDESQPQWQREPSR